MRILRFLHALRLTRLLLLTPLLLASPALADEDDDGGGDPCASKVRNTFADITMHDPVRSMRPEKALEIVAILHERGDIVMTPAPVRDPAQNCKVIKPGLNDKVTLEPTIAGVPMLYVKKFDADGAVVNPTPVKLMSLHIRNAVGIYRLVAMLKEKFQAKEVYHAGIAGGGPHADGRALDFTGIKTDDDTEYNVYRDWGLKPKKAGYRLDGDGDTAESLFRAVYEFAAAYYNDNGAKGARSQIGGRSEVLHPDHPDAGFAAAHVNHVHMDISVALKTY